MGWFGKSKKKEEKKVVKTEVERVPVKYDEKGFIDIEIEDLFTLDSGNGELCFASDRITKEGFKVGFMYREEPAEGMPDSGWRFMAGNEDDEYINNPDNLNIFAINTICNYDPDIIEYLIDAPVGTAFVRVSDDEFEEDDDSIETYIVKQDIFEE